MLTAEAMNRISVVILREDMERVVEAIARSGVLQPARVEEVEDWAESLRNVGVSNLANEYGRRRRRVYELMEELGPGRARPAAPPETEIGLADLGVVDAEVDRIEKRLDPLLSSRRTVSEKMAELRSLSDQLEALAPGGLPVAGLMRSKLLSTAIGSIDEDRMERLRQLLGPVPSVVLPYGKRDKRLQVICVVLRRDKVRLEEALREVGFTEAQIPEDIGKVSAEARSSIAGDLAALEQKLEDVKAALAAARDEVLSGLEGLLYRVDTAILLLHIKEYCKMTGSTCLLSGWVPRADTAYLIAALKRATSGRAIVEVTDAEELEEEKRRPLDIPVLLKQPSFLKPFGMLVSGYGTPAYHAIDPTLFVAITFLVMFGMMFGDIGHGFVILAGGLFLISRSQRLSEVGRLAIYCGAASIAFGILYGSFFGLENVVPALWRKPLDNITDLFKVAIGFGIVVVSLGIVLNVINSLRTRAFWENFFDKSGPLVGVVYWSGIGIVVRYLMSGGLPHPFFFYGFFVTPLVLFAARGPLLRIMRKRERTFADGVGTYIMESIVEIMEILMGYLANTVSFIRVAAFGLAHAGLFVAVFTMAALVASKPGGPVLSGTVIFLGNVLIIALEGLVVTIQALRLEYYEFFGKFFKGLGSKYEPARLAGALPGARNPKGGE
jgi:V/A-type H+-transporting ATPase subunit I